MDFGKLLHVVGEVCFAIEYVLIRLFGLAALIFIIYQILVEKGVFAN